MHWNTSPARTPCACALRAYSAAQRSRSLADQNCGEGAAVVPDEKCMRRTADRGAHMKLPYGFSGVMVAT